MMRSWAVVVLCLAGVLAAQQKSRQSSTYTYDLNGRRVAVGTVGRTESTGRTMQTERSQSVNGRSVPLESVEERVLSEGPNGRVVERIVRSYDQNGNPGPAEKIRIEERTKAGGGRTVKTTLYRADLNGRFTLAERSTKESTRRGDVLNSSTIIERPGLSGSMQVVEKQIAVETERKNGSSSVVTTYRKGPGGRFSEAARETTEVVKQNNQETVTTARYNATNTGRLEFAGQTVSNLQRHADGSETKVVDVYGSASIGRPITGSSAGLHLREQQLIERRKAPGGSVIETFSVRRVSLADSNRLGDYQLISEVVCTGNCEQSPPQASSEESPPQASGEEEEKK